MSRMYLKCTLGMVHAHPTRYGLGGTGSTATDAVHAFRRKSAFLSFAATAEPDRLPPSGLVKIETANTRGKSSGDRRRR